jgi:hypothetical protein
VELGAGETAASLNFGETLQTFQAIASDPADGAVLNYSPNQLRVFFNDTIDAATVQAADLTVNGNSATGATVDSATSSVVYNLPALPDGVHAAVLQAGSITSAGGMPVAGTSIGFRVDTLAPTVGTLAIGDGTASRSVVRKLVVTFDGLVTIDDGAFLVTRLGAGGGSVGVSAAITQVSNQTVATLTFAGAFVDASGSLTDGNYSLTILGTHVRDAAGNALDGDQNGSAGGNAVDEFFRYFGDYDGDRDVDATDFGAFLGTYRKTSADAAFLDAFDIDGDGDVDATDFSAFLGNYRTVLPPP